MAKIKGVGVSVRNGDVDFKKLKKAGVSYVIIRAGFGFLSTQVDEQFNPFYAKAKKAGLKVGAYWRSYATTEARAIMEAEACLEVINGKEFDMPIYTTSANEKCINAFCSVLSEHGYTTGANVEAQTEDIKGLGRFDVYETESKKRKTTKKEDNSEHKEVQS